MTQETNAQHHGAKDTTLHDSVARAVDFRGDVSIETADGRTVVGFVFDARLAEPPDLGRDELRLLPTDSNSAVRIPIASIKSIAFTGKDAASGKSWENWIRRYAEKKLAGESASIESEAL